MTQDELINLMIDFDHSADSKLDIDEFVFLMSSGGDLNFSNQENKDTFLKIQRVRKLDFKDVLTCFGVTPISFVKSTIKQRWNERIGFMP